MRPFQELAVWRKAHALTLDIYRASRQFPTEELYGLTSQMRRASASVPANIAEGCGRNGEAEFARFLSIAAGSASELEYHLILARDLGYLQEEYQVALCTQVCEVKRMLASLVRKVRAGADH